MGVSAEREGPECPEILVGSHDRTKGCYPTLIAHLQPPDGNGDGIDSGGDPWLHGWMDGEAGTLRPLEGISFERVRNFKVENSFP